MLVQTKEAEILGRRAQDLEGRLTEQSRLLNQSEFELKHLRQELESARKVEADLRTAIIELEGRASSATQNLEPKMPSCRPNLPTPRTSATGLPANSAQ